MTNIETPVRVRAALLAALALCSACGGGGGGGGGGGTVVGGGGSTPTTPTVTITARAAANPTTVKEGRPFTLDAAGSTASDGSTLTYSWTQVSGPPVTIATPSSAQLTLAAVEVTTDMPAQFRLTARAGTAQSETLVNVTFANVNQLPTFRNGSVELSRAKLDVKPRLLKRLARGVMVGSSELATDPPLLTHMLSYGPELRPISLKLPTLLSTALLDTITFFTLTVSSAATSGPFLAVMDKSEDRFRLLASPFGDGEVFGAADMTIAKPCGIAISNVNFLPAIIVGQETGFSILNKSNSELIIRSSQITDEPACVLLSPVAPIDRRQFTGANSGTQDVVAVSPLTNTISLYRPSSTGTYPYQLTQRAPLQLNASKPLKLVAWTAADELTENAIALVFSDGEYEGEHRLVIVGIDDTRSIVQRTHSWTGAAPKTLLLSDLNGDIFPEVVIISPDSPQAVVFESTTRAPHSIGPLGDPSYFEIGLGATAALSEHNDVLASGGTMIAFAEQKLIKVMAAAP